MLNWASRNRSAEITRNATTELVATTAADVGRRLSAKLPPTAAPTTGPSATFCGRNPNTPAAPPLTVPTASGPAPVIRPPTQLTGAVSAALATIRDHSSGISPGFWRARATASTAPRQTAPSIAPRMPRVVLGGCAAPRPKPRRAPPPSQPAVSASVPARARAHYQSSRQQTTALTPANYRAAPHAVSASDEGVRLSVSAGLMVSRGFR
jgi:hypothetical protein